MDGERFVNRPAYTVVGAYPDSSNPLRRMLPSNETRKMSVEAVCSNPVTIGLLSSVEYEIVDFVVGGSINLSV
jgi:hypothetical protein